MVKIYFWESTVAVCREERLYADTPKPSTTPTSFSRNKVRVAGQIDPRPMQ